MADKDKPETLDDAELDKVDGGKQVSLSASGTLGRIKPKKKAEPLIQDFQGFPTTGDH